MKRESNEVKLEATTAFEKLRLEKKKFILTATLSFLLFYFALPILTSFWPKMMNFPLWGRVSLAWALAFSQFIMTWVICMMYLWKARQFDRVIDTLKKTKVDERGEDF